MSIKTVRLEPEDEKRLERIRRRTRWAVSDVLRRGLRALERDISSEPARNAFEIYAGLDLGPGGYAAGPASQSRETARRVIADKARR